MSMNLPLPGLGVRVIATANVDAAVIWAPDAGMCATGTELAS